MLLDPKWTKLYAIVTSAAITKVALILLGYWLGTLVDQSLGTSPLFMMLFVCAALGIGVWALVKIIDKRGL